MEQIKKNVCDLMIKLDYPEDAQKEFSDVLDLIAADKVASAWLKHLVAQHDADMNCNYDQMRLDVKALGGALGVHDYTMEMLLFLALGDKLRQRYIEKGIDESMYYAAMADLRYKLEECRLVYGVNGTFVAFWYPHFFRMTLFAFKRLQFEIIQLKKDYEVGGIAVPAGTKLLNMHIPRTGTKLDHGDVLESYRQGAEFFADQLEGQPGVFTCNSWMLDPFHATVLSPNSNMVAFYNDFKIVETGFAKDYGGVWRVFDKRFDGNVDDLPADTSLRRAYIDRIKRGEPVGHARGIFIWKDGEIINS